MAGRSFGRGDGRGGRPLGRGFGDGHGRARPLGRGSGGGRGRGNGHAEHTNSSPVPPAPAAPAPAPAPLAPAPAAPAPVPPPAIPATQTSLPATSTDDESPHSPATPVSGSSPRTQITTSSSVGDNSSSSTRPRLEIRYGCFTKSYKVSAQITKCMKQRFDKDGYTWSKVSQQTKEYYWNEFQKHFSFDSDLESVIRNIWERQAGKRYSNTLSDWRKSGKRPQNVPQETWDSWQQGWTTPEFKRKCLAASKNRLSEVGGPGTGISKHTGGSRSAIDHSLELAKERPGQTLTDYDIFERIHKSKSNGSFIDQRSKTIADEVMARYNAATQNQTDEETSLESVDLSKIYYEVVGPPTKQRFYGLGSKPSAVAPIGSSSRSRPLDRDQLRSELYEEVRDAVRDEMREEMRQMKQRQEQIEQQLTQKQQEMEDLIQRFLSGGGPSVPPAHPHPNDDDNADDDQDAYDLN